MFKRIASFVQPAGYVAGRLAGLSGADAFIDYTYIHFSGFSDTEAGRWLPELCDRFGVPMEKLPRIVNPWDIVGRVTPAAAAECGLLAGTPIAAGMGDQAAGALGAGIVEPGMLYDVAGTASLLGLCVDRFTPDVTHRTLHTMRSVLPGLYHPLAYINGGGLNLRWFRDALAAAENEAAGRRGGRERSTPCSTGWPRACRAGSDGLLFLPHLAGRQCPNDPAVRGLWAGFTWAHGKPHLYRSLLEGVAYEYATYLRIEQELLPGRPLHRSARAGRRVVQRGVEPDQSRRAGRAVRVPQPQRVRRDGRGDGGGPRRGALPRPQSHLERLGPAGEPDRAAAGIPRVLRADGGPVQRAVRRAARHLHGPGGPARTPGQLDPKGAKTLTGF